MSVEHIDWFSDLFVEDMVIEKGEILIPDRSGIGFTFVD